MISPKFKKGRTQSGVVLIEALIGFLLFAIGVLGLVGLQASMTKAQASAKVRADATLLAHEIIGTMWADSQSNHASYNGASCSKYSRCKAWQDKVGAALPSGVATISYVPETPTSVTSVQVVITWTIPEEGPHQLSLLGSVAP